MRKTKMVIAGLLACSSGVAMAEPTPVGTWQAVSDVTGKPTSYVRIAETNGVLYGTVEKLFNSAEPNPVCSLCTGARKGKPVLGMTILRNVTDQGDGKWGGGDILDPKSGKVYHVRLELENGGQRLDVRGYIGIPMLGRSQTWVRVH